MASEEATAAQAASATNGANLEMVTAPKLLQAPLVESKHSRRDFNQPSGASGRESSPLAAATWRSTRPSLHPQSP
jgi:hypothetical protein